MTGSITIDLFTTLDGVAQAPGGPDEDRSGGFAFGGWQAPFVDATVGARVAQSIEELDALLLGRRTYDIFAGYWPDHPDGPDAAIAAKFEAIPKYVASRGTPDLSWRGSVLLDPDLRAEVEALRQRHRAVHVIGSIDLARTLVRERLFDVLHLWLYPIVVGPGKRLFPGDGPPFGLTLLDPPVTSESGALLLRYGPGGEVTTGDRSARQDRS